MRKRELAKVIPSSWLETEEYRLNAKPYFSGAVEAKMALEKFPCEMLIELTVNGKKGIFNGPRFSRVFVSEVTHGLRLISGADMIQADLSYTDMIAKWQARAMPEMVLREGTTLISSYGTVGRCMYARSDMVGHIGSDNVLKVLPDKDKIKPGYLFAFISSKFGVPIIIMGEGGSVVTYLDPSRVYQLPVPRLGEIEAGVDEIIRRSADAHAESINLRENAGALINSICGFPEKLAPAARIFAYSSANSNDVLRRLDATFHNPIAQEAEALTKAVNGISLSSAGVFGYESNRMKQVFVEEGYGTPFTTSGGIFSKTIMPERYLRNQLLGEDETWRINEYDTLVARSGQVGGIIGRGVWADSRLDGFAASPHILRLRPTSEEFPPGYVYTFLCLTDVGYQLLARTAAGSSIPFLPLDAVLEIKIPTTPSLQQRQEIDELVKRSGELRKQSQELEKEAVALVERAIEEGCR